MPREPGITTAFTAEISLSRLPSDVHPVKAASTSSSVWPT